MLSLMAPAAAAEASGSSCSSHELTWSLQAARKGEDEQEDDRLSTAAPSLCEEATEGELKSTCKAALQRWADLVDSDEESEARRTEHFPAKAASAKVRWADLAERDEDDMERGHLSSSSGSSPLGTHLRSAPESVKGSRKGGGGNADALVPQAAREAAREKGRGKGKGKDKGKGSAKGSAKGKGKGGCKGGSYGAAKSQCQFTIGIEEEGRFRVCRRILGPQGQYMKEIAESTGAKLRLRGRGSKFLEGPDWQESSDPLMLCVSAPDATAYSQAKRLISNLLEDVYKQFYEFKMSEGSVPEHLCLDLHEGPREGSY